MSLMYEDAARQPDQEPACVIGDPDALHAGHHVHQGVGYTECSCGETMGAWSVVLPTPAQWQAFWAGQICIICGKRDVIWAQDVPATPGP